MKKNPILSIILSSLLIGIVVLKAETFSTWRTSHFTVAQVADIAISGENADPDGDGVGNLLEYAFASNPWVAESGVGAAVLPVVKEEENHLTLTYRRLRTATDLFAALQATDDLAAMWYFPEEVAEAVNSSPPLYDLITLTDPQTTSATDRRFLRLTVAVDYDQDGLPDDWEQRFFGNLDHLAGDDDDFDTLTNLMEFRRQTNPADFYNGETPLVNITGGNGQTGFAYEVLPLALTVKVLRNDGATPWPNAPVIFSTNAGGSFSGGSSPVKVQADSAGVARMSYYLPETAGAVTILATAGKAPNLSTVSFTETVSSLPSKMGPITAQGNGTDIQIGWTPLPGASSYSVQRFNAANKAWETIGNPTSGEVSFSDPSQPPDTILLYKMSATDGSLVAPSEVQAGIANPDGNGDNDELLNSDEVEAGYFAQSLMDEPPGTATTLKYGGNPLGWHGPDPKLGDTDEDGVLDDLDGWANNPAIHPPRLPEAHYAVIDLEALGFPSGYEILELNDKMQILAYSNPDPDPSGYVDADKVKDVILWDMADRSTTRVPVLSENTSENYDAPYSASGLSAHHFLNNNGMVCGLILQNGLWQAAIWTKAGGTVPLPRYNSPYLSGTSDVKQNDDVTAINDIGEVVGTEHTWGLIPAPQAGGRYEGGGVKWKAGATTEKLADHYQYMR